MRRLLYCALGAALLALFWSAGAATPQDTRKAPARKSATKSKSGAKKTTSAARKKPAPSTATARTAASRKKPPARRVTWRNRQAAPTPERYKEIQNALAAKGYLSPGDANGTWGASSVDALKKFQSDQNLESTGKINSLSLIALGLGPKHEAAPPAGAKPEGN